MDLLLRLFCICWMYGSMIHIYILSYLIVIYPCPHCVTSTLGCLEVQAPSGPEYSEMCLGRMQRFQRFHKTPCGNGPAARAADWFVSPDEQGPLGFLVFVIFCHFCLSRWSKSCTAMVQQWMSTSPSRGQRANSLNPMRCARRARGEQLEDDQFEDQVGPSGSGTMRISEPNCNPQLSPMAQYVSICLAWSCDNYPPLFLIGFCLQCIVFASFV